MDSAKGKPDAAKPTPAARLKRRGDYRIGRKDKTPSTAGGHGPRKPRAAKPQAAAPTSVAGDTRSDGLGQEAAALAGARAAGPGPAGVAPGGGPGSGAGSAVSQFKPGSNVNPLTPGIKDGEVFRRGPDHISRGSIKLLLGQIQLDEREGLYRNACRIARGEAGPGPYLALLEMIGDRTEGRPVQHVHTTSKRTTVFERGAGTPGDRNRELGRVETTETGIQSGGAPEERSPIDGQVLAELGMSREPA